MISKKARGILLMTAIIAMVACAPLLLPSGNSPVPTLAPGELEVIIAQTAARAASETAILIPPTLTPTLTPSPTVTASLTPSPTATFIFLLPTLVTNPSGDSGGKYSCDITSVSPPFDATLSPGQPFSAHWKLLNNGTETWYSNSVDYSYFSGAKIFEGSKVRDFDTSVAVGGTVEIVVQMNAPTKPGTYTTVWKLNIGQESFCSMTILIIVPSK
jgi:hypothetical protein